MDDRIGRTSRTSSPAVVSCLILLATALLGPAMAHAQASAPSPEAGGVESELTFEGQGSFGNYTIFAQGEHSKLFTAGVEYSRHSWGYFLGSQMDYVGEFLPFVLLDQPAHLNYFGVPITRNKKDMQLVPGIGISPIGLRFLWRDGRTIQPYMMVKGGVLVFSKKAESPNGSYENISLRSEIGMQIRLAPRTELRLAIGDSHFSNVFIVPSNPGLDVMSYMFGISRHFGPRDRGPR